jgi:RNA polymerase sigma-70 factor (ECF subfamily)
MYRLYGSTIYARCRRILRDEQAAEDAAQEAFVRVYRHLEKVPDSEQALQWIYRVATNYCLNQIRDKRRRQSITDGRCREARDGVEIAGLDMREWMVRIPEKLCSVAWLYHVDGMNQQEVAEALGISRRTVVNRLADFNRLARVLFDDGQPRLPGGVKAVGVRPNEDVA